MYVKLNDPLMGTETEYIRKGLRSPLCLVKLNNPLMGTETNNYRQKYSLVIFLYVKLNDPH